MPEDETSFPPLDPINPLTILTTEDVVPESVMDTTGWYETETMTIVKPVAPLLNDRLPAFTDLSALTGWMVAQGWKLTSSQQTTYQIPWISYTNAAGAQVEALEYHGAQADVWTRRRLVPERPLQAMIEKFTEAYNEGRRLNNKRYNEIVLLYGTLLEKSENFLTGIQNDTAKYDELLDGIVDNLGKDFPDYETEIKARLAAMAAALTTALAEARKLLAMKGPAADALDAARALLAAVEPAGTAIAGARTALDSGVAAYETSVSGLLDGDYLAARRAEINRRFDAERAAAQHALVDRGLYNGGAYAPTMARIEEARQLALNDLERDFVDRRIALADKLLGAQTGYPVYVTGWEKVYAEKIGRGAA